MSFVAFNANFAGSPPAPFSAFEKGESVFYLVGITTLESVLPAPTAQLSVSTKKVKGSGRDPVDTVTEKAMAWTGSGRRRTVAKRSYSWERYTKGAKKAAAEAAQWQGTDGSVLVLWSNLVTVFDAEALGYKTPGASTTARPGRRGVGVENCAAATVRGSKVVALTAQEERAAAVRARAYQADAALVAKRSTPTPEWITQARAEIESTPEPEDRPMILDSEPAPVARPEGLSRLAMVALDVFDGPVDRPEFVPEPEDSGCERFRMLDLD